MAQKTLLIPPTCVKPYVKRGKNDAVDAEMIRKAMSSLSGSGAPGAVSAPDGGPARGTALVPPNSSVVAAFDASNPGYWAFHCHWLYHLVDGMFAALRYV
jgi:hypothetical protein